VATATTVSICPDQVQKEQGWTPLSIGTKQLPCCGEYNSQQKQSPRIVAIGSVCFVSLETQCAVDCIAALPHFLPVPMHSDRIAVNSTTGGSERLIRYR
jgi:hypothetical protein